MTQRLPLDFDVNDGIFHGNYDTAIEIPERIEKGEKRSTARHVGVAGPTINRIIAQRELYKNDSR